MSRNPSSLSERPTSAAWQTDVSDVLTTVMDAVRLRSRVFCRSELKAPWGMALKRSDYAHFHVIERGGAWLRIEGEEPVALAGGDLVVVPHGTGHTLADSLGTTARPLSEMAGRRASEGGCVVMRGGGEGAETRLVCGSFRFERREAHPLVELLPPLIHLRPAETPAAEWLEATLRFLAWETREARPGTETIVSRLTDVLFVQVLRAWIESLPEGRGGWMGALRDRQVGAALALVHRAPERDWTNASMAEAVGMSRSRFAARFTALVGEPPLAYVSRWRLETAAGLLQDGALSLAEVAARVGYESEAAFSKAFRRRFGTPPGAYRRRAAA
jgi:AraC-like DNA-binding protein